MTTSGVSTVAPGERRPLGHCPTWPPTEAAHYRSAGYWTGQTFPAFLDQIAERYADRPAVIDGRTRWTYRELRAAADRVAAGLYRLGVRAGDRVVVQLPNSAPYVATIFGIWRLGALPVFALPAHRDVEIEHFCAATDAAALVTGERINGYDHLALAARVCDRLDRPPLLVVSRSAASATSATAADGAPNPDAVLEDWLGESIVGQIPAAPDNAAAPAFLQLSGGTTGIPKLIPRTHDDYLYSVRASADICELTPDDVMLVALPAAHNFTMSSPGVLGMLCAGGALVMAPDPSPTTCFPLIERERVTITSLVPPLAVGWLSHHRRRPGRLDSLRLLQVGGAKFAAEAARRIQPELGCRLQQVFGMAEGLVNYTRPEDGDDLLVTTQGRPISPDDEVRVVDDGDKQVPVGEVGHLLTRGPYTIRGYYQAAAHDAVSFTADGFYRTGDLVRQLPSGHLEVTGRAKDQINRGGDKIASDEVENHLLAHPGVLDAAVVAVADEFLGERTCAFVIQDPASGDEPLTERGIRDFIRGRGLAAFKVPDQVRLVDAFPATGVGKTSRRELRRLLAAGQVGVSSSGVAAPLDPQSTTCTRRAKEHTPQ